MPHYDRHAGVSKTFASKNDSIFDDERDPMEDAAQALREVEVDAVRPARPASKGHDLSSMSIDDLRTFAAKLSVPNRGTITQREELEAAILARL